MKKLLLFAGILMASLNGQSQNVQACQNAQNICTDPNFMFQGIQGNGLTPNLTLSNPSTNPQMGNGNNPNAPANQGCLLTNGPGPQWLILTVSVSGNLGFIFGDPSSSNPQVGLYDWAMWPYTPSTCTNIFNNTLPPVSCNWNASSTGGTGMGPVPPGGNVGNYQPSIPVVAGQQFLILISNYSGVNSLVSFTSTGTASLICGFNTAICSGETTSVAPVGFIPLTNQNFTLEPLGITNNTGTFVVTPSVTTTYTLIGAGLNTQSQLTMQTSTTSIVVNPQPTTAPTVTNTTCTSTLNAFNLGVSFIPSTPTQTYSVLWSPIPPGLTAPNQTSLSGSIPPGVYDATVTSAGGCSTTTSFTVDPQPDPAIINLTPVHLNHTITCAQPTINITALVATNNYTWSNGLIAPMYGPLAAINYSGLGTWTVVAQNPVSNCISTQTFAVFQNTVAPTSLVTPTLQNITCTVSSIITVTASGSPTVNISQHVYSPIGGTFVANSPSITYVPGGPGTYTHCSVNDANGCSTCKEFTVSSTQGFPTFSVTSPQNFTLGCNSKSVAVVTINNADTQPFPGGAVSYSLIGPATSTAVSSGSLSSISVYSITTPGTWTLITKDNTNFCETRVPVSILANTFQPNVSAIVEREVLDCDHPRMTLKGQSLTENVSYIWNFPGTPGSQPGDTLPVGINTFVPTNTLVGNFTLVVTNNNNTCRSTSVIPIFQNTFPPNALISNGGTSSLTCLTQTITLSNNSSPNIPPQFPSHLPVIGYIWQGPTPQEPVQFASTYLGGVPGVYTMTAKDLNNGCTKTATISIADGKIFPNINNPVAPPQPTLDCGNKTTVIKPIVSNPNPNYVYFWTAPPGATLSANNTSSIQANMVGIYRVYITNTVTGCSSSADMSVVSGSLTASFEPDKTEGFAPLTVNFINNTQSSTGSASITTVWSFGNGLTERTNSTAERATMKFTQPGEYKVYMFAQKGECLDSAMTVIRVELPAQLTVPNVFTPNKDGVNDLFFLKANNLQEIYIKVVDRWGHTVYEVTSTTGNIAWDGTNQYGKDSAEGTYFYTLKATGTDGQSFDQRGTIMLLR